MPRRRIATRYAALVVVVLALALLVSGAVEAWISHRERLAAVESLQREKARAAAASVARFATDILQSLLWVSLSTGTEGVEQRRLDFVKLLRLQPAITSAQQVDAAGREQLRVSRIETDRIGSGVDLSNEAGYAAASSGQTHFAEVEFVAQSEPYLTIAVPSAARDGAVVLARVNLKFVQTVVSDIRVGSRGYAYVADSRGRLVSHPDLSLVLQMTELDRLPQVRHALDSDGIDGFQADGRDLRGASVLAAHARIVPLGWTVFVEQPRSEALAPLVAAIVRTVAILVAALALAAVAGVVAAYRLVAPIGELRRGAQRFGAGDLAHRIRVSTGDELQELAEQFNAMGARLRETYDELERRVAERTRDLNERNAEIGEALVQRTATAEILRTIGASPTDTGPVFQAIVDHATRVCDASFAAVFLCDGDRLHSPAHTATSAAVAEHLRVGFAVDRTTVPGRAALERTPVHIVDLGSEPGVEAGPEHRAEPIRTVLAVPMFREARVLGAIAVWRREVNAFSDKQVRLLQTFADLAVIAVDNRRLFAEIEQTSRELEVANQAKSRFLAAASHDLRQPMHALSLFVEQLRFSRTASEQDALAVRIEQAVGSLSSLLDQLLDLSKLEAGAVQAVQEDFALRDAVSAMQMQFAPLARAKGLELRIRCPNVAVRSDPLLVQRILLNLVGNAIRYTAQGGVLIGCRRRGERVRIAVWDTGCGIPADRHHDVFREFVQLGREQRRPSSAEGELGRGLGLGLAIVARLASLLETKIELRSRLARGSMFAFELPSGALVSRSGPEAQRTDSMDGAFVLVVDDDEDARRAMCGLLERWGCLTLAAQGGEEALGLLALHDRPPELVVCDFGLGPGMNGLEAIRCLRDAIGESVPAVLVTADSTTELSRAARTQGVPVVRKPASPMRMRAVLSRALASHTQEKMA